MEGYWRQQAKSALESVAVADTGDLATQVELEVSSLKTLEATYKFAVKVVENRFLKEKEISSKFQLLLGLSKGVYAQIFIAVTGPRASHYNGKYGELAIDCNDFIAECWLQFFTEFHGSISVEDFADWSSQLAEKSTCEGYGYPHVLAAIGDEIVDLVRKGNFLRILYKCNPIDSNATYLLN